MIDAWDDVPLDISTNHLGLGKFENCLKINIDVTNGSNILGQYCLLDYNGENSKIGICVPSSCSPRFLQIIFHREYDSIGHEMLHIHTCQKNNDSISLKSLDIVAM